VNPDQNASAAGYAGLLGLGAAVGLAMMAVTSTGDVLAAGVMLGLVSGDLVAGSVGVVVGIAVIGRWGSSSFAALAGGQAVLGAAGWSGPPGLVLSSWAAAVAVVLVCPRRPVMASAGGYAVGRYSAGRYTDGRYTAGRYTAGMVACGLLAAALVAGPAVGRDTDSVVILRLAASAAGVAAALAVGRACPRPVARVAGLIAAVSAAALAVLA